MPEKRIRRPGRREILAGLSGLAVGAALGAGGGWLALRPRDALGTAAAQAAPPDGRVLSIAFDHAFMRLVEAGAVAPDKYRRLYEPRGGLPDWVGRLLEAPSEDPIFFSAETAPYLLNLLWPVGLATRAGFNARSPLAEGDPDRFASTGGWRLGRAGRGGMYFNRVETVALTADQESLVLALAQAIFRPCCDNSTFFQDCNHGSAVLGLLELGAAQGRSAFELLHAARIASGYWFPEQMTAVALLLNEIDWRGFAGTDAKRVLGPRLFSASGWSANVHRPLVARGLLPSAASAGGCGV